MNDTKESMQDHEKMQQLKTAHLTAALCCMDCALDYEHDFPLDVVLTKEQWLLIHPADGGVLCANCIVKRASKLPHVINLSARITFASDFDKATFPVVDLPALKVSASAQQIKEAVLLLQTRLVANAPMRDHEAIQTVLSALTAEQERLNWLLSGATRIQHWNGRFLVAILYRSDIDSLRNQTKENT
jgi:hypothetical protein